LIGGKIGPIMCAIRRDDAGPDARPGERAFHGG
jgi:hypothetical protein